MEVLDPTVVRPPAAEYCPLCGARTAVQHDRNKDYWYILAEGFGFEPNQRSADLVKGLYSLWNPLEEQNFGNFVRQTLEEYKQSA